MASSPIDHGGLRKAAEAALADGRPFEPWNGAHAALLHELQVHQIELEMQNATLRDAQAALEASHDRYVDLFELAPVGYLTLTENGQIAESNLAAAEMLGVARNKLHGARFDLLIAPRDRDRWRQQVVAAMAADRRMNCEFSLPARADAEIRLRAELLSVPAAAGQRSLRVTLSDVTGPKLAADQMRASEARFRAIFEHSIDAILLTTPDDGGVLMANPAAQQLLGYTGDEFRRVTRDRLVDVSDPRLAQALRQRAQTGRFVGELTYIAQDGSRIPMEVTSSLFRGIDDREMTCMVVRDLRSRLATDARMASMRAELRDLLEWQVATHTVAAVAHELNQPLTAIAALAEAARRMLAVAAPPERLVDALTRLVGETDRAGRVVRQLLESLHKPGSAAEVLDVASILGQLEVHTRDSGYAGCRIHVDVPEAPLTVNVNRVHLEKVLLNLVGNSVEAAQQASPPAGTIWIDAAATGDDKGICITVRDDGPGVPVGKEREIFHPFVSGRPGGLGMGLTISRNLIEAAGGQLWCEPGAGAGATFKLVLPSAR